MSGGPALIQSADGVRAVAARQVRVARWQLNRVFALVIIAIKLVQVTS